LNGDIDLSCSDDVRKILLDTVVKTPLILFDLSDVSVIDSSGVSSLLDGEQTAKSVEISLNW
ncbi:MAG: STAS domain-containing protein, partial [Rhodospirillales bacterium]|nr:STAS domain-containing protein [Rhodospirillales bacterium]